MRSAALTASALALLLGAPALAAPPAGPPCPLVADVAGDVRIGPAGLPSSDSTLDLRSGDLRIGGGVLTAVIRVEDLAVTGPSSQLGMHVELRLTTPEAALSLTANRGPDGDFFDVYGGEVRAAGGVENLPYLVSADGVFDVAHDEVRIRVPLSALEELESFEPGTRLSAPVLQAMGGSALKTGARSFTYAGAGASDEARGRRPYVVGERACG